MMSIEPYATHVVFHERGYWSRAYTYKSERPFAIGSVVLVPTGDFYSVGKVVGSEKGFKFKDKIQYKFIKMELKID